MGRKTKSGFYKIKLNVESVNKKDKNEIFLYRLQKMNFGGEDLVFVMSFLRKNLSPRGSWISRETLRLCL